SVAQPHPLPRVAAVAVLDGVHQPFFQGEPDAEYVALGEARRGHRAGHPLEGGDDLARGVQNHRAPLLLPAGDLAGTLLPAPFRRTGEQVPPPRGESSCDVLPAFGKGRARRRAGRAPLPTAGSPRTPAIGPISCVFANGVPRGEAPSPDLPGGLPAANFF